MPRMNQIPPRPFVPVELEKNITQTQNVEKGKLFKDILANQIQSDSGLKFSKHALERMQSRNINFSQQQLERLEQRVNTADSKGAKDSLMFMDDVAMVVSVDNKTVVTCMDRSDLNDHVFTNIDSAAFV